MTEINPDVTCEIIPLIEGAVDIRIPGAHIFPIEQLKKITEDMIHLAKQYGCKTRRLRYVRKDGKEDIFKLKRDAKGGMVLKQITTK